MQKTMLATTRVFRRIFPVLVAMLLLFALNNRAFAASEQGGKHAGGGGSETKQTGKPEDKGGKPEKTGKKQYKGISVEKITLAIDSLTDETQKAELTALLEAYTSALDAKDEALIAKTGGMSALSQAASAARAALKSGLESAGFTLGSVLGWQEWKLYPNSEPLDLAAISAVIAALDDTDANKSVLSGLLVEYQNALAAQAAAAEENMDAAKETTQAARDALLEALYTAGLFPIAETTTEEDVPAA